jgi:predicted nucleotide-binding protein
MRHDDWSTWPDEQLERVLFGSHPNSVNHEKAKYILEKRRYDTEMAKTKSPATIEPSLDASQRIQLIRRLLKDGRAILEHRPIEYDSVFRWQNTAHEILIKCFDLDSDNVLKFDSSGSYIRTETAGDTWDRQNVETLSRQLSILGSCVDQANMLAIAAPAKAVAFRKHGNEIFLVHGQNEEFREKVARFLEKLDLSVTILHEKPNKGRTIIEKFSDYSNVGFAVVLLTADDKGGPKDKPYEEQELRARQNVLLELGFFLGSLGRGKVCALCEDGVEIPSDYKGVAFVPLDKAGAWKLLLAREIREAGIPLDMNKV